MSEIVKSTKLREKLLKKVFRSIELNFVCFRVYWGRGRANNMRVVLT